MRKISQNIENPFDNIIIKICEKTAPLFRSMNLTPNGITTLSVIFGLLSFKSIMFHDNFKLASVLLLVAYYFDCLDGYYARQYKMETIVGDYYDHFSDIIKIVLIMFAIYYKKPDAYTSSNIIIFLIFTYLMMKHMGCQEKNVITTSPTLSPSLSILKKLCKDKNNIRYTKYFGTGTFILIICIFVFNL